MRPHKGRPLLIVAKKSYRKNDRKYPTTTRKKKKRLDSIHPNLNPLLLLLIPPLQLLLILLGIRKQKLLTKEKKKVGVLCEVYFASSKARANARPSYFRSIRGISVCHEC
ncbi:hypothetical protein M431DRAFT_458577 [Trichoderma harzianum CBS 226.95]|uniref:Uncharacterized protein n=1 Tax=Trichoderma harzianum CBS 226.95 TaxID=983964 RepID=A0A2T4A7W4_TRIHA|nr:hypothetical protein M431DRAFT_458577 [Trichoderma harzianum CBS 226.95]PTB53165.1 hypothetical protein M431DRAFT_458577 [Trichoderma harzianum CBS 226.95]